MTAVCVFSIPNAATNKCSLVLPRNSNLGSCAISNSFEHMYTHYPGFIIPNVSCPDQNGQVAFTAEHRFSQIKHLVEQ